MKHTSIPVVQRRISIGTQTVKAVHLDPGFLNPYNVAAVPVMPYDPFTDRLFQGTPATRDNLNQLRQYPNIARMRWVRPEHIVTVTAFP